MYWIHLAMRLIVCLTLGTLGMSVIIAVTYGVGHCINERDSFLDKCLAGIFATAVMVLAVILILVIGCNMAHVLHIHIPL